MSVFSTPRGIVTRSLEGSPGVRSRKRRGAIVSWIYVAATASAVLALAVLLWTIWDRGASSLDLSFITSKSSSRAERAGIGTALLGTLWIITLTALIAIPLGVGAAVYLEEYAPRNWWTRILQTNISNLAGVPSVVYGLLGLGVFANILALGRTIITGALTMSLLVLPIIVIAGQESIRAVPLSLRQGAYALGATKWQVTRYHVLPVAMPGILTGTILALSRAIGETAPLLVAGASGYLTFNPDSIMDGYTVLPVQIFYWTSRPQDEFRELAAAGIIVLMIILLMMNSVAIVFRHRFGKRARW
ncbi:MAG TPA: phosphate ABC transporter permease PstA [Thermomicrobiales bacterium]|nr:phosphate ABC transporter permease PstA [Thermomicrobiales bacterium]